MLTQLNCALQQGEEGCEAFRLRRNLPGETGRVRTGRGRGDALRFHRPAHLAVQRRMGPLRLWSRVPPLEPGSSSRAGFRL